MEPKCLGQAITLNRNPPLDKLTMRQPWEQESKRKSTRIQVQVNMTQMRPRSDKMSLDLSELAWLREKKCGLSRLMHQVQEIILIRPTLLVKLFKADTWVSKLMINSAQTQVLASTMQMLQRFDLILQDQSGLDRLKERISGLKAHKLMPQVQATTQMRQILSEKPSWVVTWALNLFKK